MGDMVLPSTVGCLKLFCRQLSFRYQLCHPNELSLGISLILILQLADRLALWRDVCMESQIADAILEWKYLRLAVQRQIQRFQICCYDFQAMPQIVLAGMDQIEIIHISAVVFNAQLVLDQFVHAVQIHKPESLADLISQRNALALRAVYEQVTEPADVRIVAEVVMHNILQLIMGDAIKEFGHIAFEHVTAHAVFSVKLLHLITELVKTEQGALAFLPGTIIVEKHTLQPWHDHVVAQTVLYDLILERGRLYDPFLRFVDLEFCIIGYAVGLAFQLRNQSIYAIQRR